jgi:hypothetical protein
MALLVSLPWRAGSGPGGSRTAWDGLRDALSGSGGGAAMHEASKPVPTPSVGAWLAVLDHEGLEGARRRLREDELARRAQASTETAELLREGIRAAADGRPEAAVRIFTLAVLMDPARPAAYSGLAEACLDLGDSGCARRAYRALARLLDPPAQVVGRSFGRMRIDHSPELKSLKNR